MGGCCTNSLDLPLQGPARRDLDLREGQVHQAGDRARAWTRLAGGWLLDLPATARSLVVLDRGDHLVRPIDRCSDLRARLFDVAYCALDVACNRATAALE